VPRPDSLRSSRGEHGQPIQATGKPDKPEGLAPAASELWDCIVAHGGTLPLTALDAPALSAACQLWALYLQAVEAAQADPCDKVCRVAVTSYHAAFQAAAAKLGLSPADRARLRIEPAQESDSLEEFLRATA